MNDIRALIRRTSTIRDTIQEICDVQFDITGEAENLNCVLRRLQQEATRDNSPLNRDGDTRRDELQKYSDNCFQSLDEIDNFLTQCKSYRDLQSSILQTKDRLPLSTTDREVLGKFRADFIYYAFHISHLTVKASMEFLGEAKNQIDEAGATLRYAVNVVTARLLADNEFNISALAAQPEGDFTLWKEVFSTLKQEGIADSFLKEHKRSILVYIKALEKRTAFEHISEPPLDFGGCGTAQWDAAEDGGYHKSDYDSQSSKYYGSQSSRYFEDSEDHPGKPLSRKRTRSNEDTSGQSRREGRPYGFNFQSSKSKNGFRSSDPQNAFQAFKQRDGAKVPDEEVLADFLQEKPAHPRNVRDEVRGIYQSYQDKYEQRCESLLSQRRSSQDRKKDVKAYVGLVDEVERHVLDKLDEVHLDNDMRLRSIRKKIVDQVKKVLEDLEKAKERLEG